MTRTLRSGFLAAAERFPEREALVAAKQSLTYAQLSLAARRIAATLDQAPPAGEGKLSAVFGHRHPSAFAGILGTLLRGHGYVPLNPSFPTERSRAMLVRSGCRSLVVDPTAVDQLVELVSESEGLRIVVPDADDAARDELRATLSTHTVLGASDLVGDEVALAYEPGAVSADDIAYLLFTSGSTGQPKGVMVAHRNVVPFVDIMVDRYGITEADRFSNTFDLTFDLSVFDTFCAFEKGACLCVPTAQEKLFPGKYVKKNELTVWFSVPSTGVLMNRLRMLKAGAYPTLRWVLFCGEALPAEIVERFAAAAPNAIAENLYGPTELTIACTLYRWQGEASVAESLHGICPIGEPYPNMVVQVVDEELREVPRGEPGELLMTGPQMTPGYWNDPERTAKAFVVPPGEERTFYRTGDRVRWPEEGPMVYLGRADNQIKIQGYRVELGEIEAVLRDVSGADTGIAIGWPRTPSGADGVVGFVGLPADGEPRAAVEILADAKGRLPSYMSPSRVVEVREFPLNANGKVDRKALVAKYLETEG